MTLFFPFFVSSRMVWLAFSPAHAVIVTQTDLGRGIMGVVDGMSPLGVEDGAGVEWRRSLLRAIGYKL